MLGGGVCRNSSNRQAVCTPPYVRVDLDKPRSRETDRGRTKQNIRVTS